MWLTQNKCFKIIRIKFSHDSLKCILAYSNGSTLVSIRSFAIKNLYIKGVVDLKSLGSSILDDKFKYSIFLILFVKIPRVIRKKINIKFKLT